MCTLPVGAVAAPECAKSENSQIPGGPAIYKRRWLEPDAAESEGWSEMIGLMLCKPSFSVTVCA